MNKLTEDIITAVLLAGIALAGYYTGWHVADLWIKSVL